MLPCGNVQSSMDWPYSSVRKTVLFFGAKSWRTVYQKFKYLSDAVKFITDEYITDGTDEDDEEDDDDDDDDEDDDVLLIELKQHDVGRKKFESVHAKMPTDSDEEDDDELEEDDHLTTTAMEDGDDKNGVNGGDGGDNDGDDIDSDDNDDDDDHNKGDEDYILAEDPDNNEPKNVATASAHHLIPTTERREPLPLSICIRMDWTYRNTTSSTKRNNLLPLTLPGSARHWRTLLFPPR
jgi:hypothetical protein